MALKIAHKDVEFGIGDVVRVSQLITEGNKKRSQVFEGMVISIRGEGVSKSFVVRRIGSQQVGIEKIFPLFAPIIEKIDVVKKGTEGVRRAKLYYTRDVSKKEIDKIYQRTTSRVELKKVEKPKKAAKKKPSVKAKKAKK
jgi:large subunit ribosomal protein L19